ncbi:hypothetical protein GALL_208510 [mine drainage metagenome]|uniref:Uncharacterized protein n=1 Tax=mine drainage metagenome TaxID=410659 RepID=A0A1J5RZ00_9ZZZZ
MRPLSSSPSAAPVAVGLSPLGWSAWARVAVALVAIAVLWLAVGWAMGWLGSAP